MRKKEMILEEGEGKTNLKERESLQT